MHYTLSKYSKVWSYLMGILTPMILSSPRHLFGQDIHLVVVSSERQPLLNRPHLISRLFLDSLIKSEHLRIFFSRGFVISLLDKLIASWLNMKKLMLKKKNDLKECIFYLVVSFCCDLSSDMVV